MRRDDELRTLLGRADDDREQRERAGDRECGLRFVEDEQALTAEAVGRQREERLPVRLLVQRDVAVERRGPGRSGRCDRRRPRRCRSSRRAGSSRCAAADQRCSTGASRPSRMGRATAGSSPARSRLAALGVKAHCLGARFDQRGLAAAVVAGQQRHGLVERDVVDAGEHVHGNPVGQPSSSSTIRWSRAGTGPAPSNRLMSRSALAHACRPSGGWSSGLRTGERHESPASVARPPRWFPSPGGTGR